MSEVERVVNSSPDVKKPTENNSSSIAIDVPAVDTEVFKEEMQTASSNGEGEDAMSHGKTSDEGDEKWIEQFKSVDCSAISMNGSENELVLPNDELKQKIMIQVEFYFSDENLKRHAFLLNLIRRDKQSYVSLKLITNFRYVKALTDDYRVVAYCMRQSEHLELNEELTKVRRRLPVPNHIEASRSCRVVAFNFPSENRTPSIKSVSKFFEPFGDITLIHILRPGTQIPPAVERMLSNHRELQSSVCVLIEFDKQEAAKTAATDSGVWLKGVCVFLLSEGFKMDENDEKTGLKMEENYQKSDEEQYDINNNISDEQGEKAPNIDESKPEKLFKTKDSLYKAYINNKGL